MSIAMNLLEPENFDSFLELLRSHSKDLQIIVADPESDPGFRFMCGDEKLELARSIEARIRGVDGAPSTLCCNVSEAAALVGVSAHKVSAWLKRAHHPLPHMEDGRRIIVPIHLLLQWLTEEAERTVKNAHFSGIQATEICLQSHH